MLAKQMKPLGLQLDEMCELLAALAPEADPPETTEPERLARLRDFSAIAEQRCAEMRARLPAAGQFTAMLRKHTTHSGAESR